MILASLTIPCHISSRLFSHVRSKWFEIWMGIMNRLHFIKQKYFCYVEYFSQKIFLEESLKFR